MTGAAADALQQLQDSEEEDHFRGELGYFALCVSGLLVRLIALTLAIDDRLHLFLCFLARFCLLNGVSKGLTDRQTDKQTNRHATGDSCKCSEYREHKTTHSQNE